MSLFSYYAGNLEKFKYERVNNILKFQNSQFSTEVIKILDSIIILKNTHQIDTLKILNKKIIIYNKNDSLFSDFYDKFEKRAYIQVLEHGHMTKEEYDDHIKNKIQN